MLREFNLYDFVLPGPAARESGDGGRTRGLQQERRKFD